MAREIKLFFLLVFVIACNGEIAMESTSPTTPSTTPTTTGSAGTSPTTPSTTPTTTGSAGTSPTTPSTTPTTTGSAGTSATTPSTTPTTTSPAGTSATTPSTTPTTTGPAGTSPTTPSTTPTTTGPAGTSPTTPSTTPTTTGSAGTSATTPSTTPTTTSPAGTSATPPSTTTTSPAGTSTTLPSTNTTASGGVPTTTKPLDPCVSNTCGRGSTCEPRANHTFVCLCLAGDYYNKDSKSCESAKVFPGQLDLPELTYNPKMNDKTSPEFQNASQKIADELSEVFKEYDGYTESTVLELQPIEKSKVWSRSGDSVLASIEIIFEAKANITSTVVEEQMKEAISCKDPCILGNSSFDVTDLCTKKPCDDKTTNCSFENGQSTCLCKENYIQTVFSSRICIACPSGQKASGSVCIKCPFGYSGLNCNESWQLVLVVVGSLLGGLLLITLILLPIVARKSSKKSSKKNKIADVGKPYVSQSTAKAPLVNSSLANRQAPSVNGDTANGLGSFANAGVPRIPRAATTNSWDRRTNLEMTPSNSRQNLIPVGRNSRLYDDQDDMSSHIYARSQSSLYAQDRPQNNPYAQDRPQNNPYAQNRPQNNPYAQNRPQINPYAPSQGQTNAYYTHDDERRFH